MTPEQLKASILQYAIQGKLVEQRPEEGTGAELYKQMHEEIKTLEKKKVFKTKDSSAITEDEKIFDIPDSWKWVRLGEILNIESGKGLTAKQMRQGDIPVFGGNGITGYHDEALVEKETVVIGRVGFYCGSVHVTPQRAWVTDNAFITIYPENSIDREYLVHMLRHMNLGQNSNATAQPVVSGKKIYPMLFPLPPFAEQKRIVAKIEELLPYVDRYAAAYEKMEQLNAKFPEDMKKSILQYAIQGKLVEQRPEEGTGEELYRQIQAEKQRLIREGRIKKEKALSKIAEDEIPFDLPDSWKWVKLGDCAGYAQTKEKMSPKDIAGDMWSLDLEDIQKDTGAILVKTKASERKINGDKVKFHKGQVLYSKLRPYLKKILVAPDDGICTPELVPFDTYLVDENYIAYVLRSPHIDYVINSVTYGVKMPRVGTDTMTNLLIPLPPLAEQKRIVAKLEEILPLCERLK